MTNKRASEEESPEGLIPKHGGYRNLKSFQISQLVYDITVRFCDRYIDWFSRTKDQMVQAARSGVWIRANAVLVLIAVACSLLDRQLAAQADAFEKEGGFTERLYKRRTQARKKQ